MAVLLGSRLSRGFLAPPQQPGGTNDKNERTRVAEPCLAQASLISHWLAAVTVGSGAFCLLQPLALSSSSDVVVGC